MKIQPETQRSAPSKVQLADRIMVATRAFASFDLWMTGELKKLANRWAHLPVRPLADAPELEAPRR